MSRSPSPADALDSALARVAFVLAVGLLAALAGWTRGRLPGSWPAPGGAVAAAASPGVDPASTLRRIEAFLRPTGSAGGEGDGGASRLRLEEAELRALLASVVAPRLPAGVSEPSVGLADSAVVLGALLDVDRVVDEGRATLLRTVLGDTARLSVDVSPRLVAPGRLQLRLRRVKAGSIQVPAALLPMMLQGAGLRTSPEDPSVVEVPVPEAVTGVGVEAGGLWMERGGP